MFRIDEKLTKEENLQKAKEFTEKANELMTKFNSVVDECNRFVPGNTFGLSPSKKEKMKSPNEVYDRLQNARSVFGQVKWNYESRERDLVQKEKLEKEKLENEKREKEQSEYLNEAIRYCLENGLTFSDGSGLTVETAIKMANDVAFNLEVKRREEEIGDGYIGFDGQNCEDECFGWNPKDRRCSCGNRRVSWTEGYTSDFRNMYVYGEAY
jgi:hypothetical protein